MTKPKTTKPYRPLLVNMTPEDHQIIEKMAQTEIRSKSQMGRILLNEALAARELSEQTLNQASA